MRNVFTITRTDLRVYLMDRGNLLGLLVLPVIMTLFLGGVFGGGGTSQIRMDVIHQDSSDQSQQLIEHLRAVNPSLVICPADQNEANICNLDDGESLDLESAMERVRAGVTEAALVIPAGYGTDIAAFKPVQLAYYSASSISPSDPALQSIQAVLQRVNGAVVAARVGVGLAEALNVVTSEDAGRALGERVYQQAQSAWADQPVMVRYTQTEMNRPQNPSSGFNQSVPGMATFFVVFSVLGAGMYGLVRDRNQG